MKVPGRSWAYLGALLGGAVSIAANVAHSYVPPSDVAKAIDAAHRAGAKAPEWAPPSGAVIGAIFWPVALFVAIEILARVPWPDGRRWTFLRFGGLVPVAAVAAFVSYLHLSGLLDFYGEDDLTVIFGPLAVDGLMVMATGALIATGRRPATDADIAPASEPDSTPADPWATYSTPLPATPPATEPATVTAPTRTPARTVRRTVDRPAKASDVATKAAKLLAKKPDTTQAELAAKLGVSERTLRRHLNAAEPDIQADGAPDTRPVNGHPVPELVTTNS